MTNPLVIDFAWQHPDPQRIVDAGYIGVFRYLSNDPSKDLSIGERDSLRAHNLFIGLVWENRVNDATDPALGTSEAQKAVAMAQALGYPKGCCIYFAVDEDTSAAVVLGYFINAKAVVHEAEYLIGGYGGIKVVDPLLAEGVTDRSWQACAWSGGVVSSTAHVYQRLSPTRPLIASSGSYDEDVILKPGEAGMWAPGNAAPAPAPVPAPAPSKPAPAPVTSAPPFPGIVLTLESPMMHNQEVLTWQSKMKSRGWNITVDGFYGSASENVCIQFQREKHLTVDGRVGSQTWAATWESPVT